MRPVFSVVLRVLAQQVAPVGGVKAGISEPRWMFVWLGQYDEEHLVFVPALDPLAYHGVHVGLKGRLVAPPHADSRVVGPSPGKARERAQDLVGFHSLASQAPVVEHLRGFLKIGIGKKGLHGRGKTRSAFSMP